MKDVMSSILVGLWVEEENLSGGCIILVRAEVSVVLSPLMSSIAESQPRERYHRDLDPAHK